MTLGPIKPFVDLSTANDIGVDGAEAIQPYKNGDYVEQATMRRPTENLRVRTETLARTLEDTLYTRDADRALALAGPGVIAWHGTVGSGGDGTFDISDNLWLVPFLTPGNEGTSPSAPVASKYGTLTLKRVGGTAGLIVTSQRRSYQDGHKISVVVQAGTALSVKFLENDAIPPAVETMPRVSNSPTHFWRTIVIAAADGTTLNAVRLALNALTADNPVASAVVSAAFAPEASGGDILLVPQAKQFVVGNIDAESHMITQGNLEDFFSSPANRLVEGDTLCVQYASMVEDASSGTPLGGRRQSIPENANVTVPTGSFFNSRVNPERLVNALPICKVLNGKLVFIDGTQVQKNVSMHLGTVTAAGIAYSGGDAWVDGETNPPTTVENQLDKIISDLADTTLGPPRIGAAGTEIENTFAEKQFFEKEVSVECDSAHVAVVGTSGGGPGSTPAPGTGVAGCGGGTGGNGVEGHANGTGRGVVGLGATPHALAGGINPDGIGVIGRASTLQVAGSHGVVGQGNSAGAGVFGQAGAGGYGVFGRGDNPAALIGGTTSGTGVLGVGGDSTSHGVHGQGKGLGSGVYGVASGDPSSRGIYGWAPNSNGTAAWFQRQSSVKSIIGGESNPVGIFTNVDGYFVAIEPGHPSSGWPYKNTITSSNIVKAWHRCTVNTSGGIISYVGSVAGFNSAPSNGLGVGVIVSWNQPFNGAYTVVASADSGTIDPIMASISTCVDGSCLIALVDSRVDSGALRSTLQINMPNYTGINLMVMAVGFQ